MASDKQRNGTTTVGGNKKRKRLSPIGFRATAEERALIEAAADRAGLTVGSYVRSRALSQPTTRAVRRPPVRMAQLAQTLGLLGRAGGDLHAIAEQLSVAGHASPEEVQACLVLFRQAASAIMQLLGKRRHDY